ncbi:MAG: hypothetical protein FWB83_02730 [Treponema sp.]|nr:hypothetical protein [Treponema sp.]
MDRYQVSYGNQDIFDDEDRKYWKTASAKEKFQTITYLRECFYGKEATTGHILDAGRLQGFYSMSKLK